MSTEENGKELKEMRECGPCTKCCEGWLSANINGHQMHPGRPCFFLAAGKCTVYENRPGTCRNYNCAWKAENTFPMWMRPDLTGLIITRITHPAREDLNHYEVAESGGKLTVEMLNWLVQWALDKGVNLFYEIDGKHHAIGSPAFRTAMLGK
jgi:hypothetical protein